MFKHIKNEIYRIILLSLIHLILIVMTILPFDFFSKIIDSISKGSITLNEIIKNCIFMFVLVLFNYFVSIIKDYYSFTGYPKFVYIFENKMVKKILSNTPSFFKEISIGEVMGRITSDITGYMSSFFSWTLNCIISGIIGISAVFLYISIKGNIILGILVNMPYIIFSIIIFLGRTKFQNANKKLSEIVDEISKNTLESIKGIRIVKAYNLSNKLKASFSDKADKYYNANYKYLLIHITRKTYNSISISLSYLLLIVYGIYLYTIDSITIGSLLSTSFVMGFLSSKYYLVSEAIIGIYEAKVGFKRVDVVLKIPSTDDKNGNIKCRFENNIEFKNFSFSYENGKTILKDISLKINKGQTIGIIGKTGSGKTTLVKQLLGLFNKEKGIYIDGIDIENYDKKSIRNLIGYCPQSFYVFSDTIKNNILFFRQLENNLDNSIDFADFKKDILSFENGLDTVVGENGISLSGGQKQRLSIARAVISNPQILILDDSLSALDYNTQLNIITNIKNNRKNMTNIIVSHRISALMHSDNIILLNSGKIEQMGTHDELMKKSSRYRSLYYYQNEKEPRYEK